MQEKSFLSFSLTLQDAPQAPLSYICQKDFPILVLPSRPMFSLWQTILSITSWISSLYSIGMSAPCFRSASYNDLQWLHSKLCFITQPCIKGVLVEDKYRFHVPISSPNIIKYTPLVETALDLLWTNLFCIFLPLSDRPNIHGAGLLLNPQKLHFTIQQTCIIIGWVSQDKIETSYTGWHLFLAVR